MTNIEFLKKEVDKEIYELFLKEKVNKKLLNEDFVGENIVGMAFLWGGSIRKIKNWAIICKYLDLVIKTEKYDK